MRNDGIICKERKMNVLLLQEHCEKIIPCPQSILKGGDNDNIIGILQTRPYLYMYVRLLTVAAYI